MLQIKHWHSVLDGLASGVLLVDSHLRVVFANSAVQQLLGKSERGLLDESVTQFLGEHLSGDLAHTLSTGQGFTRRETPILLEGKTLAVDLSATRLAEELNDHLVLELRWVDHLSRLRRETHLLAGEVGTRELARGLAHEIKNPLGGIRGAAQLLSRELDPQADSELLDVIIDEVDRLSGLVDRLKGLESEQKNTSLNIHSVLERTRKLIESEHPQLIEVIRDYDPSIPELVGDPEQLMQAFLNLAKNAAQALLESDTPNPRLTICTRVVRQVVIAGQPHRLAIRVSLIDNGPGIPADLRETLFLPMVSGRAQGTGLGLAIAQQVVTRHQGLVEFDSEPGHTEFTITLPIRKMKGATA